MFFVNGEETTQQWRLKNHAKNLFWRWIASWARAVRKPSDLGFEDGKFILPPLEVVNHKIESGHKPGRGFVYVAKTLNEQREEKRGSLQKRCEMAASILPTDRPSLSWIQLNDEGDLLTKLIPGGVQVKGSDDDEDKEEKLNAFSKGQIRAMISKASICGHGLNWQHCSDISYFTDHSHERYYQAIRRCWRFGQKRKVTCNLIFTQAESAVVYNMIRKEKQSIELYDGVVREMVNVLKEEKKQDGKKVEMEIPKWL